MCVSSHPFHVCVISSIPYLPSTEHTYLASTETTLPYLPRTAVPLFFIPSRRTACLSLALARSAMRNSARCRFLCGAPVAVRFRPEATGPSLLLAQTYKLYFECAASFARSSAPTRGRFVHDDRSCLKKQCTHTHACTCCTYSSQFPFGNGLMASERIFGQLKCLADWVLRVTSHLGSEVLFF